MSPSMHGHDKDPDARLETGSSDLDCSNFSGADVQQWDIFPRHGAGFERESENGLEAGARDTRTDG